MSLQKVNSAWQRRLFDGPTGPEGEIAKFDDLQAIMVALTARAHSEGESLDKDVYQWYVDQLKKAIQLLWGCDNVFNTPESQRNFSFFSALYSLQTDIMASGSDEYAILIDLITSTQKVLVGNESRQLIGHRGGRAAWKNLRMPITKWQISRRMKERNTNI